MAKIKVSDLARYVVWYAYQNKTLITQLKLQKILYYLQVESIRRFGTRLFDETIEAWEYGPVVPPVYFSYCHNGAMPILPRNDEDGKLCEGLPKRVQNMIESSLQALLPRSARDLVQQSHSESPWAMLKKKVESGERPVISEASISAFVGEGK